VPEELLKERKSLKKRVRLSEYQSQEQAPKETSYDNLERQYFDLHPNPSNNWRTMQGDMIKLKAVFCMQPTNPELDIQPTGNAKYGLK